MDYFLWSQEYYEEAEKIKRNLKRMKEKLKNISMYERRTLEDNIQKLQLIYYECIHTANYLESIARGKENAA
ncbi:MAG: hypothetical protein IKB72_03660 [Ruminococcus sp.]|nr:hypothetical protein [Oscillospiraceae bacterium]MBR2724513.1 hypothetical protein [Ruminococcus sp.]